MKFFYELLPSSNYLSIKEIKMLKPQIKWTDDKIDYLVINYPEGKMEDILSYLDISYSAVKCGAQRFGVKRNPDLKYLNKIKPLIEDTPLVWYWLGFILADGWLGENGDLKIGVSEKDEQHLQKLADLLEVRINKQKPQTYGKYTSKPAFYLSVRDVINTPKIKKRFEITELKSINGCSLKCLDTQNKLLPFLGGFIDGDGCITQNKSTKSVNMIRIQCHSSWLESLTFLSDELEKYTKIKFRVYLDSQGYCKMIIHKNVEIKKLKSILLEYEIPLLLRKWNKI
jgi:hypothetical protein